MNREDRRRAARRGFRLPTFGRDEDFWLEHRPHLADAALASSRGWRLTHPKSKSGRVHSDGSIEPGTFGG